MRFVDYFVVFLIEQRNHGRSPHSESHNYQLMVDDLLEFLEKHNIEKVVLVGHSMGGKTVMHFAYQYPEKLSGLIVLDIAPKSYLQPTREKESEINHSSILKAMKNIDFFTIKNRNDVDQTLKEDIKNQRIRQFLLKNIYRDNDNRFSWRLNVDALYKDLDKILDDMDTDFINNADAISSFQVLFIKGANSKYILDEDLKHIKTIFPYAELKTIYDAGHWLHVEQPKKLVSLIVEFLD